MKNIDNLKTFLENEEYDQPKEDVLAPTGDDCCDTDGVMTDECQECCLQTLRMVMNAHMWHLQTGSHSEHEALGVFYTELQGLADKLVEVVISLRGKLDCSMSINVELLPISEMRDELEAFKEFLEGFDEMVDEDSAENVIDDILTLTDETLYKLNHLS